MYTYEMWSTLENNSSRHHSTAYRNINYTISQQPPIIQLIHNNDPNFKNKLPTQTLHLHLHLHLRRRRRRRRRRSCMGSSRLLLSISFFIISSALCNSPALARPISNSSINVNFTASYQLFIDNSGVFLLSEKGTFQAQITNSKPESTSFYFVIIHVASHTVVWSANRNHPFSQSSQLRLTADGLTLHNDTSHPIWSTPRNRSPISSMQLLESGNLILLDSSKNIVWQSFDSPTDVLVAGQKLNVGKSLVSPLDEKEPSEGSYRLAIGGDDAMLQWNGMVYWKLSMDNKAFRDTTLAVKFLVMNLTGVFLMGGNGEEVVIKRNFSPKTSADSVKSSDFVYTKLDHRGMLSVFRFNSDDRSTEQEFEGPDDECGIPMICGRLGVCSNGGSCWCAPGFHIDPKLNSGDCVPTDNSLALADSCSSVDSSPDSAAFEYFSLKSDLDYFSNDFTDPVVRGVNESFCMNLCSRNCTCLGVFHIKSSGSCYMIRNYLGSMISGSTNRAGYIKMVAVGTRSSRVEKSGFPTLAAVLLPLAGGLVIAIVALICLRRRWRGLDSEKRSRSKLGRVDSNSSADEDIELVSIPGLPVRLEFEELAEATEGFKNQIGSGGFGTVYKGTLRDGSEVAVKKITCLGSHGKREFLTEIAVIGKIHHVNLVRLRGFCTRNGQRLLVYEFMKRGSLDRALFHGDTVLDWKERCDIAVGAARGLAYLHSGCEHKIIHCDVKPENILLHDKSQVKISDFGLSKLLTPEESGLFTTMRGTRGYLAPEWLTSSAISDKTDVYSYGMVLLEIIRGKKNSSLQTRSNRSGVGGDLCSPSSGKGEHQLIYFPLYALEMHEEGRYGELVDPRLSGQVSSPDVEKMVRVALCCVHEEPSLRPSMSNVVGMLEGAAPLGEPRLESLNFLRFYGRRFTEVSTLGDRNSEPNEFMLYRQPTSNTSTTASYNSFSYISSSQVSGPR